jgi:hypothetical protein
MKRLLVCFAFGVGLLVPAGASAQLPTFQLSQELLDFIAAAPPADDLVAGEGKFAPTEKGESTQFTVSAHGEGVLFAPARGNVRINIDGVERRGTVECLEVGGKEAFIEGTLDEPVPTAVGPADDFFMTVEDNGEPNGPNPPDEARVGVDLRPEPCLLSGLTLAFGPIEQGNIVVMDRP